MLISIEFFNSIVIFYKRYTDRKLIYKKLISEVKHSEYVYYVRPYENINYNIEYRYSLKYSTVRYRLADFLIVNIISKFKEVIKDIKSLVPLINK